MSALLITLMVTLPIIALGTALYLWVRRSPTPKHRIRRQRLVAILGGVTFIVVASWESFRESRWQRYLTGYSVVAFDNRSGVTLDDVELVTRFIANRRQGTNRIGTMTPRSSHSTRYYSPESDFALERVSYFVTNRQLTFTNAGTAKRGDLLLIRIDPSGKLLTTRK